MNNNGNMNLLDIIGAVFNDVVQNVQNEQAKASERAARNPGFKPTRPMYTACMPSKAIFNVKTEEIVPVLDESGKQVYRTGENGEKVPVKKTVKLENPVLASKIYFEDGTWTVVKNSGEDTIDLVEEKLPNGGTVVTASNGSKERALAYAIVKHAFGIADPKTGEVRGANLGRRFEKIIKASVDQRVQKAAAKASAKAASQPRREKKRTEGGKTANAVFTKALTDFVENVIPQLAKLTQTHGANSEKDIKVEQGA